jgi:hypothetical protein
METEPLIAGNHLRLFPKGAPFTLPEAGTAGRNSLPGILPNKVENDLAGTEDTISDAGWIDPGTVDTLKIEHSSEEKKSYKPAPGVKVLYDVKDTKNEIGFTASMVDASPKMFELLYGTSALTKTSTTYTPLSVGTKYAWCHFEQYDADTNKLFNTVNVFCKLTVKNVDFGDDQVKYDLVATMLYSLKNSGTLVATD